MADVSFHEFFFLFWGHHMLGSFKVDGKGATTAVEGTFT